MATNAILFDLDGTIWESYSWYARILFEAVGGSTAERIEQLRAGHSVVSMCRACGLSSSAFLGLCFASARSLALYPEVIQCLDELIRRGHPLGVVTSLSGRLADPLLRELGLAEKFSVVVHAGNCRYRKPSPKPLLMALQAIRGKPSNSWYVGDKSSDAETAAAAGVRFAWASYGYGDSRPDGAVILKHFRDVLAL
jgi:HAD superfamily hydrolase (TIGR01662 family)